MTMDGSGTEGKAGITAPLRRLGAQALEVLHLRVELLSTELEAEKLRLIAALAQGLLALLLAALGLVLLSFCLLLLSPEGWRWLAALLLGLAYIGLAAWCWLRASAQLGQPGGMFAGTVAELARDRAALEP